MPSAVEKRDHVGELGASNTGQGRERSPKREKGKVRVSGNSALIPFQRRITRGDLQRKHRNEVAWRPGWKGGFNKKQQAFGY